MKFNLKERFKTYSFWFAILSAVFLLIQAIGEPLGLKINEDTYMSIVNSVLGIFVVLGIISDPTDKNESEETEKAKENGDTEDIEDTEENIESDDSKN